MLPVINFFGLAVPSYLLCGVLGFCAALFLAFQRNKDNRIKWSAYYIFIVFAVIGMFLGGKVLFFITKLPEVIADFSLKKLILTFAKSGLVFYGGVLGALGLGRLSAGISKEDPQNLINLFVPPFVLFHAFGRVGCFMTGCCYGIECSFGFSFSREPEITRFPVQLVESAGDLTILMVLLCAERRFRGKCSLVRLYLATYAAMRFVLEFFRGDEIRGIWWNLSTSQWASLVILSVILISFIAKNSNKIKTMNYFLQTTSFSDSAAPVARKKRK